MYKVIISPAAIDDLMGIYLYILENDGEEQAEDILTKLQDRILSLEQFPLRGKLPEELSPFGNTAIRELQEPPWRVFYRPEEHEVYVLSVLDGRRSMADLLLERLVG